MRGSLFIVLILALVTLSNCARRTSISGGPKDTLAPALRNAFPKNYSTGFTGNEIKLVFDEYVKLKNINKQLVVSPPMQTPPEISPLTASRQIIIKIQDTLLPNTTYSLNFGNSIEDNNEGNALGDFKYVFSTGPIIDSLQLSGTVKDAYDREPEALTSIVLYEANTFTDSTIYKSAPRYLTNTLENPAAYRFENLKAGKYQIAAIKDVNGNNRYDPYLDKIGFHAETVTIPNDTLYEMELFRERKPFRALKSQQAGGSKILVAYEGFQENPSVTIRDLQKELQTYVTKVQDKDSLHVWHEPTSSDTLTITVRQDVYQKEFRLGIRKQKPDSLSLGLLNGALHLRDFLKIRPSVPIARLENSLITIKDKDSVLVPFTAEIDNYNTTLHFKFEPQPVQRYTMQMLPGAVTDIFGRTTDTLKFTFATRNTSDYGNLRLTLENVKRFPVIIELADEKGKTVLSRNAASSGPVDFQLIDPRQYYLRVIYDDSKNGRWDTGSYSERRQAEEVIYFPRLIDVRANWDVDQVFKLP